MVRIWDLAMVEKRWRVPAYAWDLCEIWCLCEISLSRECPWWLYICSQLGFTSSHCLLLQVEVLGLAGFMYPSSGLLSWQEPDRPISRTRGVILSSTRLRPLPVTTSIYIVTLHGGVAMTPILLLIASRWELSPTHLTFVIFEVLLRLLC
jgi:hypothetical protein